MIELKVQYNPINGHVAVTGPIQDELLCLRILAMGANVITQNTIALQQAPEIVPATSMPKPENNPIILNA